MAYPEFGHDQLEQLCSVLADTTAGLTGWQIHNSLIRLGFDDPSPHAPNKRARLMDALLLEQESGGSGDPVIRFIEEVMAPVRYATQPQQFASRRDALNKVLAFCGYAVGEDGKVQQREISVSLPQIPSDISESLMKFRRDYPDSSKAAFIMMRFAKTKAHQQIVDAIKSALLQHHIFGLRADDKEYHDDLFSNVVTYMQGCGFGVAVFERIEEEQFNPNVALEVGYMIALKKPVCLLKDKTLKVLQADLVGKLYKQFDPQAIAETVPPMVSKWLADRGLA